MPATQTISHAELTSGTIVPLRFVLFQNVVSVQLFVDANAGGADKSEIGKIELFGVSAESMDMKEFKKIKHDD